MEPSQTQYHILYTMPRTERQVAQYLEKLGLHYYLPVAPKKRFWSDRVKWVDMPLLPGYIFVVIPDPRLYHKSLQHPHAKLYVRNKDEVAIIEDHELDPIRLIVKSHEEVEAEPIRKFKTGQLVRVVHGALEGLEGVVEKIQGARRVFIKLPMLNQMISTRVDPQHIEPLGEPALL